MMFNGIHQNWLKHRILRRINSVGSLNTNGCIFFKNAPKPWDFTVFDTCSPPGGLESQAFQLILKATSQLFRLGVEIPQIQHPPVSIMAYHGY
jgi:hypothetical protein